MLAAYKNSYTVLFLLVVCLIGSTPAYSQSSSILNSSNAADMRSRSGSRLANCAALTLSRFAGAVTNDFSQWPAAARNAILDEFNIAGIPEAPCMDSASREPLRAPADNPCPESVSRSRALPGTHITPGCNNGTDPVPTELSALGKPGVKIARAREAVLTILHADNACTNWFATKDESPAATFQSLSFVLDKHGPQDIFESPEADSLLLWRQPYVASATQDGGAHTAITINAHGAFYRPQGNVLKVFREGGPVHTDGAHLLTVGSYRGDTMQAQMVTLLHEFGHIIDLLPEDADNLDGKSVKNTDAVLRHCRDEVEALAQQTKQTAKR